MHIHKNIYHSKTVVYNDTFIVSIGCFLNCQELEGYYKKQDSYFASHSLFSILSAKVLILTEDGKTRLFSVRI